ncbi:phage baseplate protein [Paraburkholderia youngii]|uniref:phage baseplate protein n=1 Tax=Paraburkholderia youngii TaxID=2782701 RepID=UPI003D1C825C
MPLIPFPDVPPLPGVPDLNRLPTAIGVRTGATQLLQGLDYFGLLPSNAPQWIIADQNGNALVTPDSVVDLSYKGEQRVGSAPVEQGSFSSYNKIALPQDLTLRLSCAGKNMSRSAFLIALRSLNTSLDRVNVVTPDFVYPSYNIDRVDYKRTSTNGVSMIVAEVHFTEIRVDAYASYTDTAQPSGADSQSQGQVNTAATPTPELPGSTNRQTPLQQAVVSATSAYDAVNQNVNKITSTISNEMTQVMSGVRATLNTAGVGAFT